MSDDQPAGCDQHPVNELNCADCRQLRAEHYASLAEKGILPQEKLLETLYVLRASVQLNIVKLLTEHELDTEAIRDLTKAYVNFLRHSKPSP